MSVGYYKHYYGGQWHDSVSKEKFSTINPCNGEVIAEFAKGDKEDTKRAISAARLAFDSGVWSGLETDERAAYLLKVADILERRLEEFARAESMDVGKPLSESIPVDIPLAVRAFRFHADGIKSLKGQTVSVPGGNIFDYVTYEPVGVVGSIAPWNFPLHLLTRSIGAALAVGNTVVCKAATLTPLTATMLAECFEEAGVPAGVYNVISGPGNVVGEELLANDMVDMVALTGSEEVGRRLMEASSKAKRIKKLSLELGGKSAFIADKDCDLDGATNSAILGFCYNQGQVCVSTSRLLVASEIYDEFMNMMLKKLKNLVIGDSLADGTQMGSLISEQHLETVQGFVDRAIAEGGRVVMGGSRLKGSLYDKGSFYPPTIIENVNRSMEIFQEEVFGPVLAVTKFDSVEEAIDLANDTRFALGAAIFSENIRTLYYVAEKLNAGTVWMNCSSKSNIETPFGGNKNSGMGREDGTEGLLEYMNLKNHIWYVGSPYENPYEF